MSFGSSTNGRFKTTHSSGSNRHMATHTAGRDHTSLRHDDDGFEHIKHAQPNLRKLVELLTNTVAELVENARTELKDNTTLTSSTVTEDKELKRQNEDLRKENEKLVQQVEQHGKREARTDIAKKDELETRLDLEIRSKSELERKYKDEIVNLQQIIKKQKKEIDEQNTTAANEILRLKAELATKEERDASMKMKHESYGGLDRECQKLRDELKVTNAELDDTKKRLSKSLGDQLTYNNPNIADLSDRNRPTKLAERFQEIYDNQWTDAFELLDEKTKNEEKTISALIYILKDTMLYCEKEAEKQVNQMKEALTKTSATTAKGLPQNVKKQINDMRKAVAEYSGQNIFQLYERTLRKSTSRNAINAGLVPEFVEACFTACWLMTVQDPPVVFGPHIVEGEVFNSDMYRAYTKSGSIVEFVVWPALCLHKGGAVLCKGVAQGYDKYSRSTKSAPPGGRKKRNENIIEANPDKYAATVRVSSHDAYATRDLQSSSYVHDAYSRGIECNSREAERRNQADRYPLERGSSYHQTTTVTTPPSTYTPTNLYQHERYVSPDPTPSEIDIDDYLRYTNTYGKYGARHYLR